MVVMLDSILGVCFFDRFVDQIFEFKDAHNTVTQRPIAEPLF
jgi:hypothetical protein